MLIVSTASFLDGVLEVGGLVVAVLLLGRLAAWLANRRVRTENAGSVAAGEKSDKTILWGTTPQDFGGPIGRDLRDLLDLPERNATTTSAAAAAIEDLIAASASETRFSALDVVRSAPRTRGGEPDGIGFCLRADCIRPDRAHVSQASWDQERSLYELDEWIKHEGRRYDFAGLWFDATDGDIDPDRNNISTSLWPANVLKTLASRTLASSSEFVESGHRYLALVLDPVEEDDAMVTTTLWFDVPDQRLRKARHVVSGDGEERFRRVIVYSAYGHDAPIVPPKWLNVDDNHVIVNNKVCAVEHW